MLARAKYVLAGCMEWFFADRTGLWEYSNRGIVVFDRSERFFPGAVIRPYAGDQIPLSSDNFSKMPSYLYGLLVRELSRPEYSVDSMEDNERLCDVLNKDRSIVSDSWSVVECNSSRVLLRCEDYIGNSEFLEVRNICKNARILRK